MPPSPAATAHLSSLRAAIAGWFAAGHRDLPWRRTSDPYAIWVAEVMLQQTRVETVAPRFERWMLRFPTVRALAAAPLDEVLAEWAGLGYYARARRLHAAARIVDEQHAGRVPDDAAAIARLPGVGRYTAGAILSIAYGRPVALVDGNVERVLARLFRVEGDPGSSAARARLWSLAEGIVGATSEAASQPARDSGAPAAPRFSPSQVNQGLMELGAVVCTPRRPACLVCPVEAMCEARRSGDASAFPGKGRVVRVIAVEHVAIALLRRGRVLLARRPPEGLWGGLYELPSGEPASGETHLGAARRIVSERLGLDVEAAALAPLPGPAGSFEHVLSHRRVRFRGFSAMAPPGTVRRRFYDAHRWIVPRAAATLGVSRATTRLLAALAADTATPRSRPDG